MKKRGKWDSSSDEEIDVKSVKVFRDKKAKVDVETSGVTNASPKRPLSPLNTIQTVTSNDVQKINQLLNIEIYNDEDAEQQVALPNDLDVIPHRTLDRPHIPLVDGCRSVEEYIRLNFISQGTYGVVFRAKCRKTGRIYAIKQVKIGQEANKVGFMLTALREINILLYLKHPNIMKVREMVVGSTVDKIFMVMEYSDNDLKYCLDQSTHPFSTAEIKQLMIQFLDAINFMHNHWVIHRDLKPSNLLYSNSGKLTVCDFGMARKYNKPIIPYTREVVTLWYRCPELLLGASTYSTPLDVWSIGCIFAEMFLTKPLFPGEGEPDQIYKIFQGIGAPTEEKWPGFSSLPNASKISSRIPLRGQLKELLPSASFSGGAKLSLNEAGFDLLSRLLHMDPSKRISCGEAIIHPWLAKEDPRPKSVDQMPKFKSRHEDES